MVKRIGLLLGLILLLGTSLVAQDRTVGGTLGSNGATLELAVDGTGSGGLQIDTGAMCTCTITFEAVIQGEWFSLTAFPVGTSTGVSTTTAAGRWVFGTAGYRRVRARVSAYTSGTATVGIRASPGTQVTTGAGGGGGGSGDGAILDGVTPTIRATVFDYTNSNPLGVVLRDVNGDYVSVGGGTQYVEGNTTTPGVGTVALGWKPNQTKWQSFHIDGSDALLVSLNDNFGTLANPIYVTDLSGGTPITSDPSGYGGFMFQYPHPLLFNDGLAALAANEVGAPRITAQRAQHMNLRNNAGTEVGTAGAPLRIDPTGGTAQPVTGTFFQATQPVSGTFWPTTAVAPSSTRLSDGAAFYDARSIRVLTFAGDKVDVSGSSVSVSNFPAVQGIQILDGVSSSISATVRDYANSNPLAVVLTDSAGTAQGDAIVNIDSSTQSIAGAAINTFTKIADYDTTGVTTNTTMLGIAIPSATGPIPAGYVTTPLRVDPTGTTIQPVSGTVTVTDGAGALNVIVDSSALPAGASTLAEQQTQTTALNAINVTTKHLGASAGPVMIPATETDTVLLASNTARVAWQVCNQSSSQLLVKFGSGATTFSYNVRVAPSACYANDNYTGQVNGAWYVGADRYALVSESQ